MGVWDAIFGRGKKPKRHGRGVPSSDETDGYTREIARPAPSDEFDRTPPEAQPGSPGWGGVEDDPWAPTQAPRVAEPSPPPRMASPVRGGTPPRPIPQPRAPAPRAPTPVPDSADDATLLGGATAVRAVGRVVAVLVGVEGPLLNHVHAVYEGENVLGRGDPPERLPDESRSISREHAVLRESGRDFMLSPLKPENATFLNEQPVEGNQLVGDGDRIRLGAAKPSTFVFRTIP